MSVKTSNSYLKESPKLETEKWWEPGSGFFGKFYLEGDDSLEGYLQEKELTLEERTHLEVQGIINLLELEGGESILDLPCGYGRHSIELAKREFNITGCDLNPIHLQTAQKESELLRLNINWVLGNMLDIQLSQQFDAIINMFYSFGFFEGDNENLQVLKNFYNHLNPGGKFLFHTDVNIPCVLSGKYKTYEERNLTSGAKLVIQDDYDETTKRINGSWTIVKENQKTKKDYSVRVYESEEFVDLCELAGFQDIRCYSNWKKHPYSPQSEDMMIVAIK